jgi:hypothetical protein
MLVRMRWPDVAVMLILGVHFNTDVRARQCQLRLTPGLRTDPLPSCLNNRVERV